MVRFRKIRTLPSLHNPGPNESGRGGDHHSSVQNRGVRLCGEPDGRRLCRTAARRNDPALLIQPPVCPGPAGSTPPTTTCPRGARRSTRDVRRGLDRSSKSMRPPSRSSRPRARAEAIRAGCWGCQPRPPSGRTRIFRSAPRLSRTIDASLHWLVVSLA